MKVAIIGAGASGLSCAYQLYKNNIKPTIFEQKSWLGETLDLPAVKLNMFNTPITDPLKYLKKNYGILLSDRQFVSRLDRINGRAMIKKKAGDLTLQKLKLGIA